MVTCTAASLLRKRPWHKKENSRNLFHHQLADTTDPCFRWIGSNLVITGEPTSLAHNNARHGTPACNSCISCKMTFFACILIAVKIGLYFDEIPLTVAFILEKTRLYFRDDSPVFPVFFQPECRALPAMRIKT